MKKYNPITNPYAKRTILFLIAAIFTLTAQGPAVTSALTAEQKKLLNQNIYYYDPYNCADVEENAGGEARGTGSPNGLALPNLSTESMTEAVKQWIKEKRPSSPFIKLADEIVASSKQGHPVGEEIKNLKAEIERLKSALKEKVQVQTIEDVNIQLTKFQKKIDFAPLF